MTGPGAGLVAAVGLNAGLGTGTAGAAAAPARTVVPGTGWAWGINFAFEADPTSQDRFTTSPRAVTGLPHNVVQIAAGAADSAGSRATIDHTGTGAYSVDFPGLGLNFNSRGGPNSVNRSGAGTYTAVLPGFTAAGGNVAVNAFDPNGNYCKVVGWDVTAVNAACFSPAGAPVDEHWMLRYTDRSVANNGGSGAYVWANQASSPSYTPDPIHQWNSTGAANTITRRPLPDPHLPCDWPGSSH